MGINLASSAVYFAILIAINFFLSPFIIKSLGNEAFGFLILANSVVSYGYILTSTINSVSGRFVALHYHRDEIVLVNSYFSSVVVINFIFAILILLVSILFVINLEFFLNLTPNLALDVKIMFFLYFINFIIGLFSSVFSISAFVKNKLYLLSIRNIISTFIFGSGILITFYLFKPKLFYVSFLAILASIFVLFSSFLISKRTLPEIKFSFDKFNPKAIKTLFNSGVWSGFTTLNRALLTSADLLICNIFITPAAMGILSISKTIPLMLESFLAAISSTFFPKLVMLYSKNDMKTILKESIFYMKVIAFLTATPYAFFVVFGFDFFRLWLFFKDLDEIFMIYKFAMILFIPAVLVSNVSVLFALDTITNRLKRPAVVNFVVGIFTIITQILVLKFSDFGLFGMVLVGAFFYSLRVVFFDIINAGLNLNLSILTFYPAVFKNLSLFLLLVLLFWILKRFFEISSWGSFLIYLVFILFIGYIISYLFIFTRSEKRDIIEKVREKV